MELTNNMIKLIELDKQKKEVEKFYEELAQTIKEVEKEIGMNGTFQDQNDETVFQIVVPEWKNVKMVHVDYIRTKKEGERQGSMSMKKAK